jgi:hypothetical protein
MENQRSEDTFRHERTIIEGRVMNSNRQSGKINILALAFLAIVGMIVASLAFAKEDPSAVGAQFMDALARHDVDKLTELSYVDKETPAEIEAAKKHLREQWDFSVNVAGQHYPFFWKISNSNKATESNATVTVQISKGGPNAYDEKYELPLLRSNDKWKVDATGISRTMFPALPQ